MKKFLSVFLSFAILVSTLCGMSFAAFAREYAEADVRVSSLNTGDVFKFGTYPQSLVRDKPLVKMLDLQQLSVYRCGYYKNTNADKSKYENVNVLYTDFEYNGAKYRKIIIDEYRPLWTDSDSGADNSFQDDNGYVKAAYYFKWEPVEWTVLKKENDGVIAFSKNIVDSQPYCDYYRSVNWESSSLRDKLNSQFYYLAFDYFERQKIESVKLNNSSPAGSNANGGKDTADKIWLLSYADANNKNFGFIADENGISAARCAKGTDYAKSQGLYVSDSEEYSGNSIWWLRTVSDGGYNALRVDDDGYADSSYGMSVYATQIGVRPALKLENNSSVKALRPVAEQNKAVKKANNINKDRFAVKPPKIKKLKKGKKSFTATWKKVAGADGYQIQYSLKKNMKKAKKKTVSASKSKLKVKKLKKGKKYYVRVRTYKKIGNKTYYSKWSAKKSVKTK